MTGHRDDPRTFHVSQDREGFFIEDDYGEEVEHWPTWVAPSYRFTSYDNAKKEIASMVDNYEPDDPPGWEAGFAENH